MSGAMMKRSRARRDDVLRAQLSILELEEAAGDGAPAGRPGKSGTHGTNYDRLCADVAREHPDADPVWIRAEADGRVGELAQQLQRERGCTTAAAMDMAASWAAAPARGG